MRFEPTGSAPTPRDAAARGPSPGAATTTVGIPAYLQDTYWWAYLHPRAVQVFERQWLVNLILWGNFARLRDRVLAELGNPIQHAVLQVACVYGDFTDQIARRLGPGGTLDVIDVAPIQIRNLHTKLGMRAGVSTHLQDSTQLRFDAGRFDSTVVFFLLHEQPEAVRRQTLAEALRVTRPGGKLVLVDYHRPVASSPMRLLMQPVLKALEPFALDLWQHDITHWLPPDVQPAQVEKRTFFGGLYQMLVITR